ncbi:hypothetical protein WDU94_015516 [Cyamophila willieti]
MTARAFQYAKRNLSKTAVELKATYRELDINDENFHHFKAAAAEMADAFQEFEHARREYEPSHSDPDPNVSILTDEEENAVLSCKRFIRLLNAKIAKAEEDRKIANEERQRVDELSLRERQQERQRVDELSFRERQLEADTALKEQEMASKERIELERIRSTAATTQVETSHSSGLPKIELKKFSGDVTTFTEFLDSFNALVHNRSGLKANEKFHYLKSVVQGPVAKLIEGIRVTDANYPIALDLLKETYGSKPVIVTKLFDELNELKPVSWKPNDLYSFYQNVEVKFKLLENEGCNLENEILRSILFRKLPTSVQSELVKEKGLTFTTQDLRNVINKEAKTYIAINSFTSQVLLMHSFLQRPRLHSFLEITQNHDQRKVASSLLTNSNEPTFTNNDVCNVPSPVNSSNDIPPSPYSSQDCRNDTSLSAMTTQNDPSSSSSSDNYRVFLQSATVLVRNKSTNRNIEAHVVFDSGATASYITESLVKKLGLKCDYSRDVNVYTFGETLTQDHTYVYYEGRTYRQSWQGV